MQMLVPESLKEEIKKLYHDVPSAGHLPLHFTSGASFLDLEGLRAAHDSQELQYFVT
jgi:hypothetical protein